MTDDKYTSKNIKALLSIQGNFDISVTYSLNTIEKILGQILDRLEVLEDKVKFLEGEQE